MVDSKLIRLFDSNKLVTLLVRESVKLPSKLDAHEKTKRLYMQSLLVRIRLNWFTVFYLPKKDDIFFFIGPDLFI